MSNFFTKTDILLPKGDVDMKKWAVIACDQYTSEPEYWEKVKNIVGDVPSTLNIIIPEVYLENHDVEDRIANANKKIAEYMDLLTEHHDCLIYIERVQSDGKVRQGIIGAIDLEHYSYEAISDTKIRSTEGTILDRIPPRVKVRENAQIEASHVMILIDDTKKEIIEQVEKGDELYSFDLMLGAGSIKGWKIENADEIINKINALDFLAVGDGNHSLATAKTVYQQNKNEKARYALVELVNLHSDALEFEPIHRVLFDINPKHVMEEYKKFGERHSLPVGNVEMFIQKYLKDFGGRVDYIHGDDAAKRLGDTPTSVTFIVPAIPKDGFFASIKKDGALPRKAFSMGHSDDKRFYIESRKIK